MDTVDTWTGQAATRLQDALRMTNAAFAARIGVAERTVAAWHQRPDTVPRAEIQAALDTIHEGAPATVQLRFNRSTRPHAGPAEAQALRVAIAIVVRGTDVLLVCSRGQAELAWQFPAGVVKPGASPTVVAVEETLAETGVSCSVRERLGSRVHPDTGVIAEYALCEYLRGEAANGQPQENADVAWVPLARLTRFIPAEKIFPPILEALA